MMKTQIKKSAVLTALPLLALGAMMIPGAACGDDDNPLCCSADNFQAGATLDFKLVGAKNDKAFASAQALADFSGAANAVLDGLAVSCRNIAKDLGATDKDAEAKGLKEDSKMSEQAKVWCGLAVAKIGEFKGNASVSVGWKPPTCSVSASASMNCQAGCTVKADCDVKLNPPQCSGSLEVSCDATCEASATTPTISCEGKCGGDCSGSCQATGGVAVDCKGKCDGTCSAKADGTGGIQADGSCDGKCDGKCEIASDASVRCSGSCGGKCTGNCEVADGSASVKCDGECKGKIEPLSCSGGELKASCDLDANCEANCKASASAKAECTPPSIDVKITGEATANLAKLKATLQANFGGIVSAQLKVTGMANFTKELAGNMKGALQIKPACVPVLLDVAKDAVVDVGTSVEITGKLVASVR